MPKHNENFGFLDVLHIFEYTSHGARQKGYMLGKHLFSFFFFFFNDQERSKQGTPKSRIPDPCKMPH
jgi:hypothetical protein